jgi:hypothetical protein
LLVTPVPEPTSMAILAVGGLALLRRQNVRLPKTKIQPF